MTRLAGKKHPAPAKYAPRRRCSFASPQKARLAQSLLRLMRGEVRQKAAALFL